MAKSDYILDCLTSKMREGWLYYAVWALHNIELTSPSRVPSGAYTQQPADTRSDVDSSERCKNAGCPKRTSRHGFGR
jgi:hypothetical protein